MFKKIGTPLVIILSLFGVILYLTSIGFGSAIASANQSQNSTPIFQKNESGQTYGTNENATSLETEPDLVLALGEDGTLGYVYSKDLYGEMPKTPEEAIAIMKKNKVGEDKKIPLYDVDGKTVIGQFKITSGTITEK
ncbi:hypothetical protein NVS47_13710 [Dehalobacterium formicoaceticum]|uniref:Uncharacterized protein n=1 Tax=Dehalobacterium formicoaceticum TaxID=51515 RepID=A0ABT1Y6P6_9FIRM|nr:hypothetical protein [Dehalobacterium formicoaceticum]MCR6546554.1 hypothetical protein [Dehalobacterium formicoaceticum]